MREDEDGLGARGDLPAAEFSADLADSRAVDRRLKCRGKIRVHVFLTSRVDVDVLP